MRYENSAIGKPSSNPRILNTLAWRFSLKGKHFGAFRNTMTSQKSCDFPARVSLKTQIQNYRCSGVHVVWAESIWCLFSVKASFSNFSGVLSTGSFRTLINGKRHRQPSESSVLTLPQKNFLSDKSKAYFQRRFCSRFFFIRSDKKSSRTYFLHKYPLHPRISPDNNKQKQKLIIQKRCLRSTTTKNILICTFVTILFCMNCSSRSSQFVHTII